MVKKRTIGTVVAALTLSLVGNVDAFAAEISEDLQDTIDELAERGELQLSDGRARVTPRALAKLAAALSGSSLTIEVTGTNPNGTLDIELTAGRNTYAKTFSIGRDSIGNSMVQID